MNRINVNFLIENGLLFEINRSILHPFGLMLSVEQDSDRNFILGDLIDCREQKEEVIFDKESLEQGKNELKKFMDEYGMKKLKKRHDLLGWIIQE